MNKVMEKKIRMLQIVPSLSMANGVAACICNYFINMDKTNFEFTFVTLNDKDHGRYKIIEDNGGKIVELYRNCNIFQYIKKIDDFFKNNKFDIVHCNVANTGVIFLYFAKKYNVKVRILHSHATSSSDKFLNKIRNDIILIFTKRFANEYFACSEAAGSAMFGRKKYFVLNNCVDYQKFKYDETLRKKLRKKYNVESDFVIGNIGRLCNQKNQKFLIKFLTKLPNCKLMIIGNGPLENYLTEYACKMGVQNRIIFTGGISNTNEIYNAFDVFALPSIYEGLPVVGVEAQANGLPCIFSNNVTKEVKINENTKFIKLDINEWRRNVLNLDRVSESKNKFVLSKFNIIKESKKLELEYIDLVTKR